MYLCNVTAGNKSLRHWGRVKITSQLTVTVNDPYNTRHGAPYCDRNPAAKPDSPGPFLVVDKYDMHLLYGFVRLCHVPA
jgi:hypothetical protein